MLLIFITYPQGQVFVKHLEDCTQLLEFILSTFCTGLSTHGRLTRSSGFSFLSWAWGSEPWRQHRAAASTAPCHFSCLPMNLGRTPFAPAQQGLPWLPPLHFLSAHCFQYLKRKIKHLEDASLFMHCLTFPTTICSPRSFSINVGSEYAIEFMTILKQILSKLGENQNNLSNKKLQLF